MYVPKVYIYNIIVSQSVALSFYECCLKHPNKTYEDVATMWGNLLVKIVIGSKLTN